MSEQRRFEDVLSHILPKSHVCGRQKIQASLRMESDLDVEARDALRKYSAFESQGYKDGRHLNKNLRNNAEWSNNLDHAFVWTVKRPIILWRGWNETQPPVNHIYDYYLSCSMVGRIARKFAGDRGTVTAILVPLGTKIAYPMDVWRSVIELETRNRGITQYTKTACIVKYEAEIILPRGIKLTEIHSENIGKRRLSVMSM